jgi:hypothetical protein
VSQLEAFLLTLALESLAAGVVMRLAGWSTSARLFGAVVVASVITHPVLWAVARLLPPTWWWPAVTAMEVVIGVVEGGVLATLGGLGARRGLVVGVAMNAFSFGMGLAMAPWFR